MHRCRLGPFHELLLAHHPVGQIDAYVLSRFLGWLAVSTRTFHERYTKCLHRLHLVVRSATDRPATRETIVTTIPICASNERARRSAPFPHLVAPARAFWAAAAWHRRFFLPLPSVWK